NMELVDDQRTGLVFPSDDEQELGRGIVRLLSDEDLRGRLGVQAVKTMSDEFSIERLVTQVQEIYLG
ncbi:MAG: glycosyltransferase family 1 protein, partial [Gammaproteobacteria bacterium]|nr:glycosyltransferase family 1 protein [Gammaproteobacteria bacterium]